MRRAAAADRPAHQPDEQDVGELTRVVHRSPGVPDEAHDPSDDDHQSHRERGGDVPKGLHHERRAPDCEHGQRPCVATQADRQDGVRSARRRPAAGQGRRTISADTDE